MEEILQVGGDGRRDASLPFKYGNSSTMQASGFSPAYTSTPALVSMACNFRFHTPCAAGIAG